MKFRIIFKAFDSLPILEATKEFKCILLKTDCELKGVVNLPVKIKRFCVLRSPHIDKDSREHFELRLYKSFLDLTTESSTTFELLLNAKIPAGVLCSFKIL